MAKITFEDKISGISTPSGSEKEGILVKVTAVVNNSIEHGTITIAVKI